MKNKYLYEQLLEIKDEQLKSFYVPGHKNGNLLSLYFPGNIGEFDMTEIPGTDDLHEPEEAIRDSQNRASRLYGSLSSYFLVNGTTCGIIAMIMGTTKPGEKVVVVRDCHKSVMNAIRLAQLEPVYVMPYIDKETGLSFGVEVDSLRSVLEVNKDAKAVILTYPSYHGICNNIEGIAGLIKSYNMLMLVDEAHGAHFLLSDELPKSALNVGADIVVHSTHKSLPSLTQSSILHINSKNVDKTRVEEMLHIHQTSSPSYLLMASLDIAMKIVDEEGPRLMDQLLNNIYDFRESMKEESVFFVNSDYVKSRGSFSLDPTKLTLHSKRSNIDTNRLDEVLREKFGVQCEYSNSLMSLFISSIGNSQEDFLHLRKGILASKGMESRASDYELSDYKPIISINPHKAMYMDKVEVKINESVGRICGDSVIPYPPGVPIINPGELITDKIVEFIVSSDDKGINITGLSSSDKIRVII